MDVKIPDYQLKPLKKFYRPYFSPRFNSYEMYYAVASFLINSERKFRFYLFVININTKFLFVRPLPENTHPSIHITKILIEDINNHLKSLKTDCKIDNIRADADTKFAKMITDHTDNRAVLLGDFAHNTNEFVNYLASENITLYLNKSSFVNKNRVVDRAIRTIPDMLDINENFWVDTMYMMEVVEKYNNTKHSAFYSLFTPFECSSQKI
jgi:hypothetical protein